MADNGMKAEVVIALDDKISQPLQDVLNTLQSFETAFKTFSDSAETIGTFVTRLKEVQTNLEAAADPIKEITEATTDLTETVHATEEALEQTADVTEETVKQVEDAIKPVETLANTTNDLTEAAKDTAEAVEEAGKQAEEATQPVGQLADATNDATEAVKETAEAVEETGKQAEDAVKPVEDLKDTYEKLSEEAHKATEAEKELSDTVMEVGSSLQMMGAALMAPAAAVTGIAYKTLGAYMEVESSTAKLRNSFLAGDSPDKMMAKVLSKAEELGVSLPGSTNDMLDMFTVLREQGVEMETILNGMGQATAEFATIFKVDFAEAAGNMSELREAMGISEQETSAFVDQLQRLSGISGLSVNDLAGTFQYVGSALKTLRIEGMEATKDMSAVLAIMANSGIEGSQAGTGLAAALNRMASLNSVTNRKAFKEGVGAALSGKGVSLDFFDTKGQFIGIKGLITELQKLQKLNDQERMQVLQAIFGEQAARPMAAIVTAGVEGYSDAINRMQSQQSAAEKIAGIMGTNAMKLESLSGTFSTFMAKIGQHVADITQISKLIDKANDFLAYINRWMDDNPQKLKAILTTVAGISGAMAAAGAIMASIGTAMVGTSMLIEKYQALAPIFSKFSPSIMNMVLTVGRLSSVLGPVLLLLASLAPYIIKFWTPIKAMFVSMAESFASGFLSNQGRLTPLIQAVQYLGEVLKVAYDYWTTPAQFEWAGLNEIMSIIANFTGGALSDVISGIIYALLYIPQILGAVAGQLAAFFLDGGIKSYLDTFALYWKKVWKEVGSVLYALWNSIITFLRNTWNSIVNGFNSFCNTILGGFNSVLNNVKNVLNTFYTEITNLKKLFFKAGDNIIGSLIDGLKSNLGRLTSVAETIKGYARNMLPEALIGNKQLVAPVYGGTTTSNTTNNTNRTYNDNRTINIGSATDSSSRLMLAPAGG